MSSPYRGESESLREELRASLHRITPTLIMLLPEALRARVAEARAIVEAPVPLATHLEAAREAIAMAPDIERRLDELPSELPVLPDASGEPVNETLLRLCLPARVSDVQIGEIGGTATFRCDGHPFVRRISVPVWTTEPTIAMYTAVRRGLPRFDLYTRTGEPFEPGLVMHGSSHALTRRVRSAARALGRTVAARATVADGLASVVWSGSIDARRPHERAIALLAALREVRSPPVVLLR